MRDMEVLWKYALDYNISAVIKICNVHYLYGIINMLGIQKIAQRNESYTNNDMMKIQQ